MSFIAKLKLKQDTPLYILRAPAHLTNEFQDIDWKKQLPKTRKVQQGLFFAENSAVLENNALTVLGALQDDGLLWIAYPKKSGTIPSDLHRDISWEIMSSSDWESVASISIDNDWSGIRFRHKNAVGNAKRLPPIEERKVEGIDFINRKVTLPRDAAEAIKEFPGLETFFYSQSFTCQKEYAEAIVEAKKPETRQRRIDKTIEMLLKLREENELKALKKKK